jgi:hypothetical protein
MQCPVCRGQARNLTPNTLDGVVVGCDRCGDYRVAGDALHSQLHIAPEKRVAVLQAAKETASQAGWPYVMARGVRSA